MRNRTGLIAINVGVAALLVAALALAPTTIDTQGARATAGTSATHSWVADAFPIGQAGFAHAAIGGSDMAEAIRCTAENVRHAVESAWPAAVVGALAIAFVILV